MRTTLSGRATAEEATAIARSRSSVDDVVSFQPLAVTNAAASAAATRNDAPGKSEVTAECADRHGQDHAHAQQHQGKSFKGRLGRGGARLPDGSLEDRAV